MKTVIVAVLSLTLTLFARPLLADEVSKDEIVCKLDPKCAKPLTRSLRRGITISGGQTAEEPPSVNLYVNFAYDSADLTSDARIVLDRLGAALRDPRLNGFKFMIAGHTDSKGGAQYNQKLSERRADAVKRYLISQYSLSSDRLSTIGYGMTQLLDPSRPEDGVNRRVQVINTSADGK